MNYSLNDSRKASRGLVAKSPAARPIAPGDIAVITDSGVVLVREAGMPFHPPLGTTDPFVEWLSLMEVVQMLCHVWPTRCGSMQGREWKI